MPDDRDLPEGVPPATPDIGLPSPPSLGVMPPIDLPPPPAPDAPAPKGDGDAPAGEGRR